MSEDKTMRKNSVLRFIAGLACVAAMAATLTACGKKKESTSLRTQLETPTNLEFNWEDGTMSFTAVENATYYRVYFFNITEPNDALGNTDYFKYTTEEVIETYPDGQTGTSTQIVYEQNDDGSYVTIDRDELFSETPTFSKRYAATYLDANEDKQSYQAGDTVTLTLPNDSIGGGTYYIAVKAGGPIALYTMSDYLTTDEPVVAKMHNVDPEISLDYSNTFNQYGTTTKTQQMGNMTMESSSVDTTNEVLDGNGMMFEISNAETLYNSDANIQLSYRITDSTGAEVPFSYTNVRMKRNDSNTFCGWELVDSGSDATEGTASVSHYIYSHSGPTMEYQTSGFFYINGLTVGETYTLYITAPGDGGATSYDSGETSFEFTYIVTEWTASSDSSSSAGAGMMAAEPDMAAEFGEGPAGEAGDINAEEIPADGTAAAPFEAPAT